MSETNGTNPANANGRSDGGRFAPGHTFSRKARTSSMAELRRATIEAETPERVREVLDKMRERAVDGDSKAAKVYLDCVIGRPPVAVELSGPDGEALGVDFARLEAAIQVALAPFGDGAKFAVAAALRGLVIHAGESAERPGDQA